jgi:putative ABC transport system permease protein
MLHVVAETDAQVSMPGIADSANVTAYSGNPAWSGLVLISGHWYSGQAEADVNTLFLTDTGTTVGSEYTFTEGRRRVAVRITGEVFDPGKQANVYLTPATWAALDHGRPSLRQHGVRCPGQIVCGVHFNRRGR